MQKLHVGVVGLGIGGAALATLLARQGHRVTVLEQASAPGPVGAGFLLQPSGQEVLERLGLLAPIAAASEPIRQLLALTHRGRKLIELGYGDHGAALGVHRGLVFTTLHQAALAAGVEVRVGFAAGGWREEGGKVFARAEIAEGEGAVEAGPFDLLVAADGARSGLRVQVDPAAREATDPYAALWFVGPCTTVRGYLFQVAHGSRKLTGLLPIGGNRANFFWGLPADGWDALRAGGFAAFRAEVLSLNAKAIEIFDELRRFDQLIFAPYRHALPKQVHRGPVVLLGDAAHATAPHLGQGANLALLDAETLATELATATDLASALERYAQARRAQNRYYVQLSRLLAPFFQGDWPGLGALRDLGLPLMPRVPWLRTRMQLALAGRARGWV